MPAALARPLPGSLLTDSRLPRGELTRAFPRQAAPLLTDFSKEALTARRVLSLGFFRKFSFDILGGEEWRTYRIIDVK